MKTQRPQIVLPHETQHLDQKQLARRWRVSPRTLERWRWQKDGPSFCKIGGRVIYLIADIEEFEERQHRSLNVAAASRVA